MKQQFILTFLLLLLILSLSQTTFSGLLSEPAKQTPDSSSSYNTVPAFPTQTTTQTCHLDLSNELFGGVRAACSHTLDRSRCCPVLAAWLFAAHARSALQITNNNTSFLPNNSPGSDIQPMMPDDSQKCVDSLQESLIGRDIRIPQPNASCDAVLCFCGIRLHQITSLSCPAAFNLTTGGNNNTNGSGIVKPSLAVRNLEKNCRNSSYAGCTKCLGALQKVNDEGKNGTKRVVGEDRASKMMVRDCQLMGLTWLLARNKTAHIPTVSAVLRAIMYSAHPPHQSTCSPDQENMPLAVDSLQFETNDSTPSKVAFATVCLQLLSLIILWHLYL